jgi:hypothetical protein
MRTWQIEENFGRITTIENKLWFLFFLSEIQYMYDVLKYMLVIRIRVRFSLKGLWKFAL